MSRIISIGPVLIIQGLNLVYLVLVAEMTLLNRVREATKNLQSNQTKVFFHQKILLFYSPKKS